MVSAVTEGSFEVYADASKPAGMVFMNSTGNNLGYLSLGNGIESIPLNKTDTGVTSIDLQTLVSSGNIVEPGHNPIGTEISMTASDIASYVFSNGALGTVIKSPDVDGDGIVDVAAGIFYRYVVRYEIKAGNFGSGQTPVLADPIVIFGYMLEIKISGHDVDFPSAVSINGPPGSGIESAESWLLQSFGTDGRSYCAPPVYDPPIPPAGTYVVAFNTRTLTYNLPSQAEITECCAIPVPTVFTNGDGTIQSVSWEYRLSDGSATIDPKALILDLILQIEVDGGSGQPSGQAYHSPNLPPEITEHVLTDQSIQWDSVKAVVMTYHDVFGNMLGVMWSRQSTFTDRD